MFNLNLTINAMQPTIYIDSSSSNGNKKSVRHRYLKYVEHWIDKAFTSSCKNRNKIKVLQENVIKYVDTFRFYNVPTAENPNDIQFCIHNIVYKNGESSVSTYMQLIHLGCILKFETTFFLNNPNEVMLNVTKEITSADIASIDALRDPSKIVKLSSNYINNNYQEVMHNLEDFDIAKRAIHYLYGKDGDQISGEDINDAYRDKFGAYMCAYIDQQKIKDFIKFDKSGKIIGFDLKDLIGGNTNIAELLPDNLTEEADMELLGKFNASLNSDVDYEIVVDNNHMIPIEQIYTVIPQLYIDNMLYESYDVFAFLTQNNCANNDILNKVAHLIIKHHNHKVNFIEYLRNDENIQCISQYTSDDNTIEEDKAVTDLLNGTIKLNDENRNAYASLLLRTVCPNFDDIIGYNHIQVIYSIDSNLLNELVTARLGCVSTLVCDELVDLIKTIKQQIIDKYNEIRKSYGIHCTVNNMYYLYSNYMVPIYSLTTNTYQNLKAFDDMNYIFSDDEDDDDD